MCMRCLRSPATPKSPGEAIYIAHKLEVAVCSRWGHFCASVGSSEGGGSSDYPVTKSLNYPLDLSDEFCC